MAKTRSNKNKNHSRTDNNEDTHSSDVQLISPKSKTEKKQKARNKSSKQLKNAVEAADASYHEHINLLSTYRSLSSSASSPTPPVAKSSPLVLTNAINTTASSSNRSVESSNNSSIPANQLQRKSAKEIMSFMLRHSRKSMISRLSLSMFEYIDLFFDDR